MELNQYKKMNLLDIVNIERAQKSKKYQEGNIIIQVSASKGQILYLKEPQYVESKYVVLKPKIEICSKYLYYILNNCMFDFLRIYQSDINIQPEVFKFLNIDIHTNINTQRKIAEILTNIDDRISSEESMIGKIKDFKKWHLEKMFPKNQEKTPKIRFKGFFDAWEQRKVGEISRSYSGGTPIVSNKNYYIGDIPFIRSGEINSENTEFFINELALQNSSAKMIDKGDILYALYGATSGEVARSKLKGAINQAILAIKPISGYDYEFIAQWLRVRKNFIVDKYLQGGQGNLSGEIIKGLQILLPNLIEQQLVGCLFNNLDNLITLHQRKYDKLLNVKKALLDKMFPKNQEKTPKIRFKGFFDAWEQRKVGEISRSYSGGTPIVSNKNYYIGDIPFIRSGEINSENTEFFINELALQNSSAKMIDKGDILYALYGATSGEVARSKLKGAINQAILAIKPISGYDYEFIAQWLRVRKNFIVDKYLQGGQGNLSGEIIKGLQILLPNLIEQQLVGCLFNNLDNLITLHQSKCEKLKNIKKALLDKMFV